MENRIKPLSDRTFNNFIHNHKRSLIFFWGSWCPVCKQAERMLPSFAEETDIPIGAVNVDHSPHTASHYHIMGTPAFFLFHDGKMEQAVFGSMSSEQLKGFIGDLK